MYINKKKKQQEMETIQLNHYTYIRYFNWIKDLAISLFEWENLPEGCDSKYLERTLFEKGEILFFYDDILELFLNLPYVNKGTLDVYGRPIKRQVYGINYNHDLDNSNSVIIYNNSIHTPDQEVARYYAKQITEIKRSIDVNVKTQKFPFIMTCPQNQILTMKQMYNKISQNEPLIMASDKFGDFNNVSVLKTDAPYIADQLHELYEKVMGEVMEYFGVNASQDKKERMIVSEVMNGLGMTEANREVRMKVRKDACEQINEMFGLDVNVKFRKDVDMMEQAKGYNLQFSHNEGVNFERGEINE